MTGSKNGKEEIAREINKRMQQVREENKKLINNNDERTNRCIEDKKKFSL